MSDRIPATCQAVNVVHLMAAPPVENNTAADTRRSRGFTIGLSLSYAGRRLEGAPDWQERKIEHVADTRAPGKDASRDAPHDQRSTHDEYGPLALGFFPVLADSHVYGERHGQHSGVLHLFTDDSGEVVRTLAGHFEQQLVVHRENHAARRPGPA